MLFKMAWRNTFRHKRRTAITALAIAISIMLFILFDTLYGGMKNQSIRLILDYKNSALVMLPRGNFEDYRFNPVDNLIENPESVISGLYQNPNVSTVVPRLRFNARVNKAGGELIAMGMGIDPELDPGAFRLDEEVEEGSFVTAEGHLVMGAGLAEDLGVSMGDPVMVSTKTRRGYWELREYNVSGLISTGNVLINNNTFLLSLNDAQNLLGVGNAASEINISVRGNPKETERLEEIAAQIENEVGGKHEIFTWLDMNMGYFDAFETEQSVVYVLALIIIAIAVVGIVNTMLLSVYERIPELGMLRAMGFSGGKVLLLLVFEAAVIGFFACLGGVVLGWLASLPLVHLGLDLTGYMEGFNFSWPIDFHIFGRFSPATAFLAFVSGWGVSVLASMIPARKATRIEPSQALRSV